MNLYQLTLETEADVEIDVINNLIGEAEGHVVLDDRNWLIAANDGIEPWYNRLANVIEDDAMFFLAPVNVQQMTTITNYLPDEVQSFLGQHFSDVGFQSQAA